MSHTTDKDNPGIDKPKENGQNEVYLVLSPEELAKGFIRPYRNTYIHIGHWTECCGKLVHKVDPEDYHCTMDVNHKGDCVVMTEKSNLVLEDDGRIRKGSRGCGTMTTMSKPISETYARDPKFYGATFCTGCKDHLPVNEFIWAGSKERVGS